jgi:O-antigen ligase
MSEPVTAIGTGERREPLGWHDRLIEAGALFLLVFTPLAYGTVEPWSEAIAELTVLAMAVVWALRMARDWEIRIELPPGWVPALLFLLLVALQATPLPVGVMRLVSPWTTSLHEAAGPWAGADPAAFVPLSLDVHETVRQGLKLAAVAAFFLILYNTYRTRGQVHRAIWTMIAVGTLVSVFGIVQRVTWNGHFYWIGPQAPHANAFGPFVNRAHFAGLMVVVVPMALALLLGSDKRGRRRPARGWRDRLRRWNSEEPGPTRLIPFLVVLMGAAALVAGSRGGVVALVAALLAMIGLGTGGRAGWRTAIALALILLAAVWIGGDILYGTATRLAEEVGRPEEGARARLWADAVGVLADSPITGAGLGTFESAFPSERSIRMPVTFTHAESDWVQLATDTGVAGVGLVLMLVAMLALALARRHYAGRGGGRLLALAALVALAGVAVRGVGNYNVPVFANALFVAAAAGLALLASAGTDRVGDEAG